MAAFLIGVGRAVDCGDDRNPLSTLHVLKRKRCPNHRHCNGAVAAKPLRIENYKYPRSDTNIVVDSVFEICFQVIGFGVFGLR